MPQLLKESTLALLKIVGWSLLCVVPVSVYAQKPPRGLEQLSAGMSQSQVLGILGAPNERIEKEVQRQNVWVYSGAAITFLDGKLIDNQETDLGLQQRLPASSAHKSRDNSAPVLMGILDEISKNSGPAEVSGASAANANPFFNPNMNPGLPMGGGAGMMPPPFPDNDNQPFPLGVPPGMVQPIPDLDE